MLLELTIKNFAIIEDIRVEFDDGLNVLTGETGSGKSIIIDALSIVLGERASKDIIKKGSEFAYIEAVFTNYDDDINKLLEEQGISSGDLIVISKDIRLNRPAMAKVNDRTVSNAVLNKITDRLIDIFAQNESASIMKTSNQKKLIDSFGSEEHKELLTRLSKNFDRLTALKNEYIQKNKSSEDKAREIDLLKYQVTEIEEAQLSSDDDENLENKYKLLFNASEVIKNINASIFALKSSYENSAAEDMIDSAISFLTTVQNYDTNITEELNELEDIRYRIKDLVHNLENYLSSIDYSEEKLYELENRINLVNSLKSKYGNTTDKIYSYLKEIKERLEFLENYDREMLSLKVKIEELESKSAIIAEEVSSNRREIAEAFQGKIKTELRDLNIKDADFKVRFTEKPLSHDGTDDLEFMLITNKGEDFKPLAKIVSGGEMSRVMLAFKSILAQREKIQTMVFDEIDSGISGVTAQIVGEKIKKLSENAQVIVISHLPQIVSIANSHYVIEKIEEEGRISSKINKLDRKERIQELARLIGGLNLTQTALKAAEEMLFKKEK
ncbi:DNA repair protein RecN [Peptoniphilus sp. ING2-D1G]|nr:DNA repair protein RecN [Peptoniphilus sp. ING2-D1G]